MNPRYPVYVISKGRWKRRSTVRALDRMHVPHYVVVEPQEYDDYASVISKRRILTLPFSNLQQGATPARNWVWEHSLSRGDARHWIVDDNIFNFQRLNAGLRVTCWTGSMFYATEQLVDRYENFALAGFQYRTFAVPNNVQPPFYLNTRIYSCILVKNDLPYRWRGRMNEDTDLSLCALKAGWCTILINAFIIDKAETMTTKGGNTDVLYKGDGRLEMAEILKNYHPDVTRIMQRWGRWQHYVDYRRFKRNKPILKEGVVVPKRVNNYGMTLKEFKGRNNDERDDG